MKLLLFCSRYLYYFLKAENAAKEELCSVLKGLLAVDPTSELSKDYVQLTSEISETGMVCQCLIQYYQT